MRTEVKPDDVLRQFLPGEFRPIKGVSKNFLGWKEYVGLKWGGSKASLRIFRVER
jgi:hypothetical protein